MKQLTLEGLRKIVREVMSSEVSLINWEHANTVMHRAVTRNMENFMVHDNDGGSYTVT